MGEKSAEEQRRVDDASFRRIVEQAPEPIGVVRKGHFVYANPAMVAACGRASAEDLYRVPIASMLDEGDGDLASMREGEIASGQKLAPISYSVHRPDGSQILLE